MVLRLYDCLQQNLLFVFFQPVLMLLYTYFVYAITFKVDSTHASGGTDGDDDNVDLDSQVHRTYAMHTLH